jgi:hypothetical protein
MGVDYDAGRYPVSDAQNDIGRLARNAWKFDELLDVARHLAAMSFDERSAGFANRLRLAAKETRRPDDGLDLGLRSGGQCCRRREAPEELLRHPIHDSVGAPRAQHRRDEELPRVPVLELDARRRNGSGEVLKHQLHPCPKRCGRFRCGRHGDRPSESCIVGY